MKNNQATPAIKQKEEKQLIELPDVLPILPLRDVVIFPYMIFPILIGRESSLKAVNKSIDDHKFILLLTQKEAETDEITPEILFHEGTIAKILQVLKLPNGLMKVLVDGIFQAKADRFTSDENFLSARSRVIEPEIRQGAEFQALIRQLTSLFYEYVKLNRQIPSETLIAYENINDPLRKLYYVAANILIPIEAKQSLLRIEDGQEQYYELIKLLTNEIDILNVEMEIDDKVHQTIQKSQRKYYVQEQIKILQRELGEEEELPTELKQLKDAIVRSGMPKEVEEKANEEFNKLRQTASLSPEFTVGRNYLDWLVALPWQQSTNDNLDIAHASNILDEDHYGLEKPKARILEHIAVLNLVKEMKGQILCFVGPPGVGKTSLGKSIARALGRKLVRVSLGGMRDEAEIRGHRRTYIGSMPGKIIQSMRKAGSKNPVMLLDEIDKMSMDFRGDPSSAMLEVLDPEQNYAFNDHYLEVDFDLSKVLFITTANVRYNIPAPLLDRMEVIELPGYLDHEKIEIAKRHLIPKQIHEHGIGKYKVKFSTDALQRIIRAYTREAGVRNLEREVATICRKIAKEVVDAQPAMIQTKTNGAVKKKNRPIDPRAVDHYLGVPKFQDRRLSNSRKVGSVLGLAWTNAGGDILEVEVTVMPGKEKLTLTGQLGEVMKESAHAALSYIRSHHQQFGLPADFYEKKEAHVHLPEGAIPKDGPSAGITMMLAMLSAFTAMPVRGDVAMTGEITLRGDILAIGGLTEKLLAAQRNGIKHVLIPKDNEPHLSEIAERVTKGMKITTVNHIDEAIPIVFEKSFPRNPATIST